MELAINKNKRKAALFLCALFIIFNIVSYKEQAAAIAPVIAAGAVVGAAAAATLLVLGGIYFAQTGDLQNAAEKAYSTLKTPIDAFLADAKVVLNPTTSLYKLVAPVTDDAWSAIKSYISDNFNVGAQSSTNTVTSLDMDESVSVAASTGLTTPVFTLTFSPYQTINFYFDGQTVVVEQISSSGYPASTAYSATSLTLSRVLQQGYMDSYYVQVGTAIATYYDVSNYTLSYPQTTDNPDVVGMGDITDSGRDWVNSSTGERELGVDMVGQTDLADADVTYYDATGDQGGVSVAEDAYDGLTEETASDVAGTDLTGVQVDNPTDVKTDDKTDDYNDADQAATDAASESIPAIIFSKFPFCIPWDFYHAMQLLAAPAVAPEWKVDLFAPLKSVIAFQGSTEIDINMADYPTVGAVIRWCETVGFSIMLIFATRKLIWK